MLSRRTLILASLTLLGLFLLSTVPFHNEVASYAKDRAAQAFQKVWSPLDDDDEDGVYDDEDDDGEGPPRVAGEPLEQGSVPFPTDAPLPPQVPQKEHDPVAADWRTHLEAEHSGIKDYGQHSSTLGFDHIYVLTSQRDDGPLRQKRMSLVAKALGAELTFVQTTDPSDAKIVWIGERAQEVRQQKVEIIAKASNKKPAQLGGLRSGSVWLHPDIKWRRYPVPYFVKSSGWHWKNLLPKPRYFQIQFPPLTDDRYDGFNWIEYLHYPDSSLDADDPNADPLEDMHDPLEKDDRFQVSKQSIAEWYDYHELFLLMDRNKDRSALVLKDDVDVEFDFEKLWTGIKRVLPDQKTFNFTAWHLVNLGYESSLEQTHPHYIHPLLHSATEALNLTAFAVSRPGYMSLLTNLADPWIAYQTRFDIALATLSRSFFVSEGLYTTALASFSVVPPLFARLNPKLASWTPDASGWKEVENEAFLADSTMERLWTQAGLTVKERPLTQQVPDAREYRLAIPKRPSGEAGREE